MRWSAYLTAKSLPQVDYAVYRRRDTTKRVKQAGGRVKTERLVPTDQFILSPYQGRFTEVDDTAGGVLIINSKTGKAYRDNYEAFLQQQRKRKKEACTEPRLEPRH